MTGLPHNRCQGTGEDKTRRQNRFSLNMTKEQPYFSFHGSEEIRMTRYLETSEVCRKYRQLRDIEYFDWRFDIFH